MGYRKPRVGDLVYHYVFPKIEWVALLIKLDNPQDLRHQKAYVKMVPGTKYEDYFSMGTGDCGSIGWIYKKWLWVYDKEEDENEFKIFKAPIHRE
jgi:hypothetical protein